MNHEIIEVKEDKILKPGGRLVTLSHHYQLQPSQSDKQFFSWLKSVKARFLMKLFMGETPKTTLHRFLNLGSALKHGERKTNVNLQLIVIDQP